MKDNLNTLKERFIQCRKFENDNDEEVYEECFKIINIQMDKDLFPVLFYSLYDEAETLDYTNSMVKVICKYIASNDDLWTTEVVLDSAKIIFPHAIISYSIILNFIITTKPKYCQKVISKTQIKEFNQIINILDFIIIKGGNYGLDEGYAKYFKAKINR